MTGSKCKFVIIGLILILLAFLIYNNKRTVEPFVEQKFNPTLERLKQDAILIEPRASSLEFYTSDSSFTENKKRVFLCLEDENGIEYPYNQLLEVLYHELAHAFTDKVDEKHVSKEWNNKFREYMKTAIERGLYDPNKPKVDGYCQKTNTQS